MSQQIPNLEDLLPPKLLDGLMESERKLWAAALAGEIADYSSGNKETDSLANAENWEPERILKAEFVRWICINKKASEFIDTKGVQIEGAKIAGALDLESCLLIRPLAMRRCTLIDLNLSNANAIAIFLNESLFKSINADGLSTKGNLFLKNITTEGEVRLYGANIGGNLEATGATFNNKGGDAFNADRFSTKGSVFLKNITAEGEVRLLGANLGGNLEATGATFNNKGGDAFCADGLSIRGNVFLKKITAEGEVRLLGANLGGDLEATGASFKNEGRMAFAADGLSAKGTVFLKKISTEGEVRLPGANINGNLEATEATFKNKGGDAFNADRLSTKGDVFLEKVTAEGEVRLLGANIGGNLDADESTFKNGGKYVLNAENMKVKQAFFFSPREAIGVVDLMHANVGQLVDSKASWSATSFYLDGFEYGALAADYTPKTAEERLQWLRLQPKKPFHPQPYEQLAKVFRQMGHESDRKKVLIAKYDDLRRYGELSRRAIVWNWLLGFFTGHGYSPWRILLGIAPVLFIGAFIFHFANNFGFMQPSDARVYLDQDFPITGIPSMYPKFNATMYSVDAFVPFLNLYQKAYWLPDVSRGLWAHIVRIYLWFHIFLGWFFSTIFVAGISRILRE